VGRYFKDVGKGSSVFDARLSHAHHHPIYHIEHMHTWIQIAGGSIHGRLEEGKVQQREAAEGEATVP
jgi:hypothetical protein